MTDFLFINAPIPTAPADPDDRTIRLLAPDGVDPVSHGTVTYTRQADGCYHVPATVARHLTHGGGFSVAPPITDGRILADIVGLANTLASDAKRAAIRAAVADLGLADLARRNPPPVV